jgi:copper chaperone NosL
MKNNKSRILMIIGSALLLVIFLFPLWRISLDAPQFPEGINMYIWVNQVTGDDEATLQNVNILNHYIGMQKIEPDSIAELQYFPYIIIAMAIIGVLFGIVGNKKLILTWVIIMSILGILGIYDFYLWLYDYGHNLDPMAPIKVPGMVYQPPLFGSKWLLNFHAHSYPATGTYILSLSVILAVLAFFIKGKKGELNEKVN